MAPSAIGILTNPNLTKFFKQQTQVILGMPGAVLTIGVFFPLSQGSALLKLKGVKSLS